MVEADGKIWISTTDGFWVADQRTLEIRRLNITDKRFTSMFFDRTSGEFYLGTADGFAISSPEALLAEHTEKPLILTAIYINNQLYHATGKTDPDMTILGREDKVRGSFACQLVRSNMSYFSCAGIYLLDAVSTVVQQCPYLPLTVGN